MVNQQGSKIKLQIKVFKSIPLKKIALLAYSLIIMLVFFSCKSSKNASSDTNKNSEIDSIVTILEDNSFHPTWFKAKAKLQTKMDGRSMSFSSTILSKDKEMLWLNGKMFGIEGARILVTKDSVFALNRLQKSYLADDIDWVADQYALPQLLAEAINLDHLQDIFIGNPILDVIPYTDIIKKESDYLLAGSKEDYTSSLMVDASTMQTRSFYLAQSDSELTVEYSDYRKVDDRHAIAHRRDITVKRPNEEDILLSIIYNSVDINKEQNIKFDIPSNYSKM